MGLQERRTQLFSATMTSKVAKLQRACLRDPVKVEADAKYQTVSTLRQQFLFIPFKFKVCGRYQLACPAETFGGRSMGILSASAPGGSSANCSTDDRRCQAS